MGIMHASLKHKWDISGETFHLEEAPGRRWLKMSESPITLSSSIMEEAFLEILNYKLKDHFVLSSVLCFHAARACP